MFKKLSLLAALLAGVFTLTGADYSALKYWQGMAGQASQAPEMVNEKSANGSNAAVAKAVVKGNYQGLVLTLEEAVPAEKIDSITFDLGQNIRPKRDGFAAIVLRCSGRDLVGQFKFSKDNWGSVTVRLDKENFPELAQKPLDGVGNVKAVAFSMFAGFNSPGQYMGVANFKINLKPEKAPDPEVAAELDAVDLTRFRSMTGQAPNPPELSKKIIPGVGVAVVATAVSKGAYQGLEINFPEPVDLTDVGAITFDFGHNVWRGRAGGGAILMRYDQRNGLMGVFNFGKTEWSKVRVPLDLRTLKALSKQSNPTLGKVSKLQLTMYAAFDEPGEYIGVANLTFEPKQTGSGLIKVDNYKYAAAPTSGDKSGKVLIDGKIDEADQPMFRQYSDNPDIIFDLGALYLVDKIELSAVAVPGQNISDYSISTSKDGRSWKLSGHVRNFDNSAAKKSYTVAGKDLTVIGRYIRIKCERSRTDFPLHLAEVSFFGKIPTDEELAEAAKQNYELGPQLPEVNDRNYLTVSQGNASFKICRTNGVVVDYQVNGQRIAERIFDSYELNDGKKKITADSYTSKVKSITAENGSVTVKLINPALPDVIITEKWYWDEGTLARRIQYDYSGSKKYIAYSAIEVVLPQQFRNGGVYETWGAGHEMQHKFAGEVVFDFAADTGPVVVFESPANDTTVLTYRYKYNDEYIHIGSGTVTVAGFGDKRSIFTANGLRMGDGIWQLDKPGTGGSVTSHVLVAKGDLTSAFDKYLNLSEVSKYRSSIKRPAWLKDWRLQCGQGWDGYFAKNGQRYAEHMSDLIREGWIIYGGCDSDWAWGDFPTEGYVRNLFGGRLTPKELQDRDNAIRQRGNIKVFQYTWLWSASKTSKIYAKHPDWFISHDQDGRELSFFPGCGINYYRLVGIPESADEIVSSITRFVNFYNQDLWYLDGGGSPATVDWKNMRLDAPNAWDKVLYRVRTAIQQDNPERAFFCNHPENPVADFGYLESFGGLITTNWRDGATWMYKFKLWQRDDPMRSPLYIYWLGGDVDTSFRQYVVGTGLGLTFGGSNDKRQDAALISVYPQSRWARLVDADIKPNWRYEPEEMFEIMPLTFGRSGWLFIKNHEPKTASRQVSFDAAKLGLTDSSKPVYHWCFTLRNHKDHKGLLGEKEREANYRASRWASDFLLDVEYLGATDYSRRIERKFDVNSKQLKLWYTTQSPALVYSVDEMRNQLWLDNTMGVQVSGSLNGSQMTLQVKSERKSAEIAALIPVGQYVKSVKVNGKNTNWNPAVDGNTRLALISVGQGNSDVEIAFAPAAGRNRAVCKLDVSAAKPGQTMRLALTPAIDSATLVITNRGDMVWAKQGSAAEIKLPNGITGGEYTATAYDAAGNMLAQQNFKLAAGRPQIGKWTFAEHFPQVDKSGDKWSSTATKGCGNVYADPVKRTAGIEVAPMPTSAWAQMAAGFECELQRYVKIRVSGNLWYYNIYGLHDGIRGLHIKWDNPGAYLGMVFDFADASGNYTKRVQAGLGHAQERYVSTVPNWGAKRSPDAIASVSNYAVGKEKEEIFWLDLHELGAPDDWNGKVYCSLLWNLVSPDRNVHIEILDSRNSLPSGAVANKVFFVRGGKKAELKKFKLPRTTGKITIDGIGNDAAWKNALEFKEFFRLGAPGLMAPPTSVKLIADSKNLYLLAELNESADSDFTIDKNGKPWYNDGIEIYIRTRNSKSEYVQYILALAGQSHQERVSRIEVGAPRTPIEVIPFKISVNGKKAFIEAEIPLKVFGEGASGSRFNIGRNRMQGGNLQAFSIAGGKAYLNFDALELIW
ncbi:MAG: hypothetical protein E7047_02050 [Lentisphaerae bacterium]|nr:hypothetical protein [Lentisphaerota bacterium]